MFNFIELRVWSTPYDTQREAMRDTKKLISYNTLLHTKS